MHGEWLAFSSASSPGLIICSPPSCFYLSYNKSLNTFVPQSMQDYMKYRWYMTSWCQHAKHKNTILWVEFQSIMNICLTNTMVMCEHCNQIIQQQRNVTTLVLQQLHGHSMLYWVCTYILVYSCTTRSTLQKSICYSWQLHLSPELQLLTRIVACGSQPCAINTRNKGINMFYFLVRNSKL